jgi:UDP-N-acetylmuramate--alanine ligase
MRQIALKALPDKSPFRHPRRDVANVIITGVKYLTVDMKNGRSKVFFSGIGGSGVSAMAQFVADKGHDVTGSDRAFDGNPKHPALRRLINKGIRIVPQDGSGIDGSIDHAVFSTAVEDENPEALKAKALGIRIIKRPEYLAQLASSYRTVAVSGTSGKSTVSGLLSFLMQRLGFGPNFMGGGGVKQFLSDTSLGNYLSGGSEYLVMEACESDGSIVNYRPAHSVILNLDLDHHPVEQTAGMFEALAGNTEGMVLTNADDKNLDRIDLGTKSTGKVSFSIDSPSEYMATDITYMPFRTEFTLNATRFGLQLPGRHNLLNALSCLALLGELGVSLDDTAGYIGEFIGIRRRFDIHLNGPSGLVIDDYAHNPHKIAALMSIASRIGEGVCYIFQPHGYSPTKLMKDAYIETFASNLRRSDLLIILPIYYAGGTVDRDISSEDLASGVRKAGGRAEAAGDRVAAINLTEAWDCTIVFGARDETLADFAGDIARHRTNGH